MVFHRFSLSFVSEDTAGTQGKRLFFIGFHRISEDSGQSEDTAGTQRGHSGDTPETQRKPWFSFLSIAFRERGHSGDTAGTQRGHSGDTAKPWFSLVFIMFRERAKCFQLRLQLRLHEQQNVFMSWLE